MSSRRPYLPPLTLAEVLWVLGTFFMGVAIGVL
jgi:hypothetical protein